MLVVTRFDVEPEGAAAFLEQGRAALDAFAGRPGFARGHLGRAADDPRAWVLVTQWDGVGSYRRALGAHEVKVHAAPLLAQGRDEPSAFEVLRSVEGDVASVAVSHRAADADVVGLGRASGPATSDL
ncbi:MAG TPA: antibiotic biosynthesis monooxygenase family protein [Mycobacteriales bacterium]|nr:antibiotic biosynthesis monooxygenase family protein [Mycobacteriales bacterium]